MRRFRKRTFKRRNIKRRFNRRRNRRAVKNKPMKLVMRRGLIIPDMYFVKMKYVDNYQFGNGVLTTFTQEWRGNGPFDPDFSVGGHQPLGWDQLSTLYNNVLCYGSTVKIRGTNLSTTVPLKLTLTPVVDSTAINSVTLAETTYARTKICGTATGSSNFYLKNHMTVRKMYGLSKLGTQDDDYISGTTALPVNQFFWQFNMSSINSAAITANAVTFEAEVIYYMCFFKRISLASS